MYLYIFEDGTIGQSPKSPTQEDMLLVENGLLTVLKMKGGQFVYANRDHVPVAVSEIETDQGVEFHTVPS